MIDFDDAVAAVDAARTASDVFGADGRDSRAYHELAKVLHPDRAAPGRRDEATRAFAVLAALWRAANAGVTVTTARETYVIGAEIAHDDVAAYHPLRPAGLLRIARTPGRNDLMELEAEALAAIERAGDREHAAYFPVLRDAFTYRDPATGADRRAHVFASLTGFVTLATVAEAYPDGLDARDAAWMWRRLLVALGTAHRAGVVHGAVLPDHVLIHPGEHGLVLHNWCYAAKRLPALVARYRDWYPPETPAASAAGDIYLATRCMQRLMGERAPAPLARFIRGCLLIAPAARPQDAWALLGELDELLGTLYGPRRFRPFALPATAPAWPHTQGGK